MIPIPMRTTRRIAALCVFALTSTAACATEWAAQPLPQGPQPAVAAGTRLRVTRVGGEVLYLSAIDVRGDSLYGALAYYVTDPYVALPLSDVARLEAQRTSTTVPVLLGLGAAALVFRWLILPRMFD
jgi:hypothetical protein